MNELRCYEDWFCLMLMELVGGYLQLLREIWLQLSLISTHLSEGHVLFMFEIVFFSPVLHDF